MRAARGRVRVSIVAGTRRVDLLVPDGVPVAELVPVFASAIGDHDDVSQLAVATLFGTVLRPDLGLAAQHVADGAILVLSDGCDEPPVVYDDVASATGSSLASRPAPHGLLVGLAVVAAVTAVSRLPGAALPAWLAAFGLGVVAVLAIPHATASWLVTRVASRRGQPIAADAAEAASTARHVLGEGRAAALVVLAAATAVVGTTVLR